MLCRNARMAEIRKIFFRIISSIDRRKISNYTTNNIIPISRSLSVQQASFEFRREYSRDRHDDWLSWQSYGKITCGHRENLIKGLDRLGHGTGIHLMFATQTRNEGRASCRSKETSGWNSRSHYRSLGARVADRDASIECFLMPCNRLRRKPREEMLAEISHGRTCN